MNNAANENEHQWIDGSALSLNELSFKYNIPKDEVTSFQALIRVYPQDSVIIREGDNDRTLYLLRSGSVGIYRTFEDGQRMIATVDSVNFVGEMSLINEEPRSATVIANSEWALTYAITKPNFSLILSNPKWAEILISRLSKDLNQANSERISVNKDIHELKYENNKLADEITYYEHEIDRMKDNTRLLLDAVLVLQRAVQNLAVIGSKGWYYVNSVSAAVRALAGRYAPALALSEKDADLKAVRACLVDLQRSEARNSLKAVLDEILQEIQKQG